MARKAGRRTATVGGARTTVAKTRGRKPSALVNEAAAGLARFHHLQAGAGVAPVVDEPVVDLTDEAEMELDLADVVEVPQLPSPDDRLRACLAAGWGTLSHPLFYGLMRTGMPYGAAVALVTEHVKLGLIVPRRGGGLTSWAAAQ